MSRGELDKRVALRAQELLAGADTLLLIGGRSALLNAVSEVEQPADAQREHGAALWIAPRDPLALRSGLAQLRRGVRAGARVLLAVRRRPPMLHQVRGLLGGPSPQPVHMDVLCAALVTAGLALPRVHEGPRGWFLLSASVPSDPCALDSFFTQPLAS